MTISSECHWPAELGSQERLWSIYGEAWGWPTTTMTAEADREDLARLDASVPAWIGRDWPLKDPLCVGRDLTWSEWIDLPDLPGI